MQKHMDESKNLIFRPDIKPMIAPGKSKSKSPRCIPADTHESRRQFKQIKGMEKHLERSYKVMLNREEKKLMEHNLGKVAEQQKTIDSVVNPGYAYQDVAPSQAEAGRISTLNPKLDGHTAKKYARQGSSYKLGAGVNYKQMKQFLRNAVRDI